MKGRPYLALILSMIFWAFSFVWFKIANVHYGPITIIFIRLLLSVIFLSSFLRLTGRRMAIKRGDRRYFFLMALFEPFLYFLGESFGLTYVSSTAGSVIISTIPVFAVLSVWLFYRERLKTINYVGVIISFIGVIIFITSSSGGVTVNPRGLALMLLAVVAAVGYNTVLHRIASNYDPVTIVNVQNMIGGLLFLPLFLIFSLNDLLTTGIVMKSFGAVILLAIFASSGAFVLFAHAVRIVGVARANVFTNLIPLFTAIFAFLVMGDRLTIRNGVGMAVVIAGLFLSQAGSRGSKGREAGLAGRTA